MAYDTNLKNWSADGKGTVERIGAGEWEVSVETPFTLWCPQAAPGNVEISFDNRVMVEDSAMLLIANARNWRGKPLLETPRTGEYADYSHRDMECYTIGFNRAAHVSNDIQPNASTANVRRIGGEGALQFADVDLRVRTPEMMARWHAWNTFGLLCSAYEPASGTNTYYSYRAVFEQPKVSLYLGDNLLFTVVDHKPNPLCGGHIAIRNMTLGGKYRLKNLVIRDLQE